MAALVQPAVREVLCWLFGRSDVGDGGDTFFYDGVHGSQSPVFHNGPTSLGWALSENKRNRSDKVFNDRVIITYFSLPYLHSFISSCFFCHACT